MTDPEAPPIAAPLGSVTTERLELRPFADTDLDGLAAVFAKPEVWQYPYGRGFTRAETKTFLRREIDRWAEHGFGLWLALTRETSLVIGYVGISVPTFLPEILPAVEVGWRLDPDFWGQGLATEAARAALREGFTTMGLGEITSIPQVDNLASRRVCERLGMRLDRTVTIPANEFRGGVEAAIYRMTKAEWSAVSP